MTPEEFRQHGHAVVDWIADYRARRAGAAGDGADRARRDQGAPAGVAARPARAVRGAAAPTSTPSWRPAYRTGSIPSSSATSPATAALASVLGDYVSTGLGVLGLAWQSSPALTEVEEVTTDWLRQMVGLSSAWERRHPGHRLHQHAGGADLRARTRHRLRAGPRRPAGRAARAGRLHLGARAQLGRQGGAARRLRPRQHPPRSPCDAAYAMRPDALAAAIAEDRARRPRAVRRRRHDRHDDDDRARSGAGRSRR